MDKSIKVMMYEPDPCRNDRKPKPKKKREPNLCKKGRDIENPYEVLRLKILLMKQRTLIALGFVVLNHHIPMNALSLVLYMLVKLEKWLLRYSNVHP